MSTSNPMQQLYEGKPAMSQAHGNGKEEDIPKNEPDMLQSSRRSVTVMCPKE